MQAEVEEFNSKLVISILRAAKERTLKRTKLLQQFSLLFVL